MPSCVGFDRKEMKHAKCHANKTQMPGSGSNQHAHLLAHVLFRQSTEEGKLTFSFITYWNITKQTFVLNLMSSQQNAFATYGCYNAFSQVHYKYGRILHILPV